LTGLDAKALSGREWPLDAALSQELLPLFRAVAAAGDCERGFARLQDGLEPLWRDSRPQGLGPPWLEDWARGLVARAALSGPGKSARQIQRRVKAWTGQSQRDLQVHARVETVFARTHAANDVSLSELAADMGYADQSHMGREVKRITGHSPAQMSRLIATDERFWCYRLLGERF
jgi:AraC-like DNA-binding protein